MPGAMPSETVPPEEFAALVRTTGLALTPQQIAELHAGYAAVAAMARNVRQKRGYLAEPAHVFACERIMTR